MKRDSELHDWKTSISPIRDSLIDLQIKSKNLYKSTEKRPRKIRQEDAIAGRYAIPSQNDWGMYNWMAKNETATDSHVKGVNLTADRFRMVAEASTHAVAYSAEAHRLQEYKRF